MKQRFKSPYTAGNTFLFRRHLPPPPIGSPYPSRRTKAVNRFLQSFPKLEVCLMLPPTESPQPDSFQQDEIKFEITKEVSVKNGNGAQVVLGTAYFRTATRVLIAKIFDPLYYPEPGSSQIMISAHSVDFTEQADRHYTREAAAYAELDPHLGGKEVPKYYGSWTCDIPAYGAKHRPVRLILLEYISSPSMLELEPKIFAEDQQREILGQLLEAAIKIAYYGVQHRDLAPRNVLVSIAENSVPRVVVFDFGLSVVHRLAGLPILKDFISIPKPPFNHSLSNYLEWEYLGWAKLTKEWMEHRWGSADFISPPEAYMDTLSKRKMIIRNTYVDKLPQPSEFSLDLIRIPPPAIAIRVLPSSSRDSISNGSSTPTNDGL